MRLFFARDATCLGQLVLMWPRGFVAVGLGADDDLPLRPWPAFRSAPLRKSGWSHNCAAWFGAFVSWGAPPASAS